MHTTKICTEHAQHGGAHEGRATNRNKLEGMHTGKHKTAGCCRICVYLETQRMTDLLDAAEHVWVSETQAADHGELVHHALDHPLHGRQHLSAGYRGHPREHVPARVDQHEKPHLAFLAAALHSFLAVGDGTRCPLRQAPKCDSKCGFKVRQSALNQDTNCHVQLRRWQNTKYYCKCALCAPRMLSSIFSQGNKHPTQMQDRPPLGHVYTHGCSEK